jgi:hypothetical protein
MNMYELLRLKLQTNDCISADSCGDFKRLGFGTRYRPSYRLIQFSQTLLVFGATV